MGANYVEANGALGKKDFLMRVRISGKETRESIYWLKLLNVGGIPHLESTRSVLINEATELLKIFNSIITKSTL